MGSGGGRKRAIARIAAATIAVALAMFGVSTHIDSRREFAEFDAAWSADILRLDLDPTRRGLREGTLRREFYKTEGYFLELRASPPFSGAAEARKTLEGISVSVRTRLEEDGGRGEPVEESTVLGASDLTAGEGSSGGARGGQGLLRRLDSFRDGTYRVTFEILEPAPAAAGRAIRLAGMYEL